jgi:hypothetical protein
MILTDSEKRMRDGAEGAATAAAMDLLIRYGNALACDRLCDVRNVAGTMTQPWRLGSGRRRSRPHRSQARHGTELSPYGVHDAAQQLRAGDIALGD